MNPTEVEATARRLLDQLWELIGHLEALLEEDDA